MNRLDRLEKLHPLKSIIIFSFPSIVALVLESLTGIVDTAFAGNIGGGSTAALSAMGALNPIMSMLVAIQLLFGLSTGILIAKSIGENDREKSITIFRIGYLLTTITSITVSLIILIFMDPIISLLGASGETFILAKKYLTIAIISNIFSSIGYMLVNIIRSIGHPTTEMIICIVATIINVALNYLFTIVLDFGITGIAVATLCSEVLYFTWSLYYLKKIKFYYSPNIKLAIGNSKYSFDLFKIGFVQFLMQAMLSLTGMMANIKLIEFGSLEYLACRAVLFSVLTLLIMPLAGLSGGIQNILSFFIGRKNNTMILRVLKYSLLISFIYGLGVYLLIIINPAVIIGTFTSSPEVVRLSSGIIGLFLISFPLSGVFYILITFMQVNELETSAMILTILRQVILFLPLIFILPILFKNSPLGINQGQSVFLATPISDIIVILISLIYLYKLSLKYKLKAA
ncbi:MAG: MATE family efflux transporter [Clostridium sp.]